MKYETIYQHLVALPFAVQSVIIGTDGPTGLCYGLTTSGTIVYPLAIRPTVPTTAVCLLPPAQPGIQFGGSLQTGSFVAVFPDSVWSVVLVTTSHLPPDSTAVTFNIPN